MIKLQDEQLKSYVNGALKKNNIFGFSIHVKKDNDSWYFHEGHMKEQDRFFIASTTKMFVCAIVMKFVDDKIITLDDLISKYLDQDVMSQLHQYKSIEYSKMLTIKHLLSNTSGLPDYFDKSLVNKLVHNEDQAWSFQDVIDYAKTKPAKFPPGFK